MEHLAPAIELSAAGIELLALTVIVMPIAIGTVRYLLDLQRQRRHAYERYKMDLGKGLLLGLEFLIAADIIRTIALEPTLLNVGILGLLVVVRTFLSWSVVVEIEGRWPWRAHERGVADRSSSDGSDHESQAARIRT